MNPLWKLLLTIYDDKLPWLPFTAQDSDSNSEPGDLDVLSEDEDQRKVDDTLSEINVTETDRISG